MLDVNVDGWSSGFRHLLDPLQHGTVFRLINVTFRQRLEKFNPSDYFSVQLAWDRLTDSCSIFLLIENNFWEADDDNDNNTTNNRILWLDFKRLADE